MWLCLTDCFLSIVAKDCGPSQLLVRARRRGDIQKVFPKAKVTMLTKADYRYRSVVKKTAVVAALSREVERITYGNFKSAVDDQELHDAYLRVWTTMAALQPVSGKK